MEAQNQNSSSPRQNKNKRRYTGRVSRACQTCKKGKRCCDEARPCGRCTRLGIAETCIDAERKRPKNQYTQLSCKNSSSLQIKMEEIPKPTSPKLNLNGQHSKQEEGHYPQDTKWKGLENLCLALEPNSHSPPLTNILEKIQDNNQTSNPPHNVSSSHSPSTASNLQSNCKNVCSNTEFQAPKSILSVSSLQSFSPAEIERLTARSQCSFPDHFWKVRPLENMVPKTI